MPGIFGVIDRTPGDGVERLAAAMAARLARHEWHRAEHFADPAGGWALGRSTLGYVNAAPQPFRPAGSPWTVVMDGELYEADQLRKRLEAAGHTFASESHAAILLAGYLEHGREFFVNLAGAFAVALWNDQTQTLILANDRFGLLPVYYAQPEGGFVFASSLQSVLADSRVKGDIDWEGISQFFTFGHYLNENCSVAGVKVLPTAAWFEYDARSARLEKGRLRPERKPAPANHQQWLEQATSLFQQSVQRRTQHTEGLGLALSGGLDARTALAAIDPQTDLQTVCLGMRGSLDHSCAQKMASLFGCRHHPHYLDESFLSSFETHLENMVRLTDGQYLSQCIVMPTLPLYRELGVKVLLRGHAGELMHMEKAYNYSLDGSALAIQSEDDLEAWLSRRLQAYILDGVEGPLFRGERQEEIVSLARQSLRRSLQESADEPVHVQRLWRHFLSQRLARETVLSLMKFRSVVEVRLPYLDAELIDLLLAAPVELKRSETIQAYMLQRLRPEFLKVINANTGAPVGASRIRRKVASFKLRVLAKLGAPGYQPYERLGLWLRRELAPLVRKILLSEECLQRDVFTPETVRSVVSHHLDGRRNHTFLLLALLVFETGQRRLNSRSAAPLLEQPVLTA